MHIIYPKNITFEETDFKIFGIFKVFFFCNKNSTTMYRPSEIPYPKYSFIVKIGILKWGLKCVYQSME